MVGSTHGCGGVDESIDFSIPEKIILSDSFEQLAKECKSYAKKVAYVSENNDHRRFKDDTRFMPFAKATFDFQSKAHHLLSWLKIASKALRSRPVNLGSISSLLMYKKLSDTYFSLEPTYNHVRLFTEQLSLFARPVSLSITLPFLDEPVPKFGFENSPFSPRNVLAKDYAHILKQVDGLWSKIGLQLRGFDKNATESTVFLTLHNEVAALSSLIAAAAEKTDGICTSLKQNLPKTVEKVTYRILKVEHLRLKKISRRLDNVQTLINYLKVGKMQSSWLDLSAKGIVKLTSDENKTLDLIGRVHEIWLKQLELREIFKRISPDPNSNQPLSVEFMRPKPNSTSLPLPTFSNMILCARGGVGWLCSCLHRLRASNSDPCLRCMQSLKCLSGGQFNFCKHFTASGESGFVSESENVWRHCRRYHRLPPSNVPHLLSKQRARKRFRSLSFPCPIALLECLPISQTSESSKDESSTSNQMNSFGESTPIKAGQCHNSPENVMMSPPFESNPNVRWIQTSVSPIGGSIRKNSQKSVPYGAQDQPSSQSGDSTFSMLSTADLDNEGDAVEDIALVGATLVAPEEEDSAFVTSFTSHSLHVESDNEEIGDNNDGGLFENLYRGNGQKGRHSLTRSLPSLCDKRIGGCSILRSMEKFPERQQAKGEMSMEEAYVPIFLLDEENEEAGGGDTTPGVESDSDMEIQEGCNRPGWSPFSCRSEDLASLAAALRLSPEDSKKLSEVLHNGLEVINWMADLEKALYLPYETSATYSLLCRLRPDLSRMELDKCLSRLQYYSGELKRWRQELDTVIAKHKERLADFEPQADKLLASDHGFLSFFPSWLDMLASRCTEVEQGLQLQLRVVDYIDHVNYDTEEKMQEIVNQAEPVIAEAQCVVQHLTGTKDSEVGVGTSCHQFSESCFRLSSANIPALTERLQDLLERASELDPHHGLPRRSSIDYLTDNQVLRARLRSSLASLHNLFPFCSPPSLPPQQPPTSVSTASPSPWDRRKVPCIALLLLALAFLCYAVTHPGWYGAGGLKRRCDRDCAICFGLVWSNPLCIIASSFFYPSSASQVCCPQPPPT